MINKPKELQEEIRLMNETFGVPENETESDSDSTNNTDSDDTSSEESAEQTSEPNESDDSDKPDDSDTPDEPDEPDSSDESSESDEPPESDESSDELEPDSEPTDDKDRIIENLRARIAELEAAKPVPTKSTESDSSESTKPESSPEKPDTQDFVGDLDVEDLITDKESFNKFLNNFRLKIIEDSRKVLGEEVLRSIPDIVKTNIVTVTNLQKASEQFYAENEDLKPFKKVVASVFEELASENPDKPYNEIMKEVAPEVRKRLELHRKATNSETKTKSAPRLPTRKSAPGRASAKPNTNPLLSELEEMNKSLGIH